MVDNCCPQTAEPKGGGEPPAPSGGEEAKAKAHELADKDKEARAKAAQDGKPVTGESPIKPTSVAVPPTPKSQAKPGEAPPPAKQPAQKPEAPKPKAPQGKGGGAEPSHNAAAGGGAAAAAAAGGIDAEVAGYLKTAPHDESKNEIPKQVKQLVDSAKNLKESAPPIQQKGLAQAAGDTAMGAAKMFIPGMDSVGAKPGESDLDKLTGKGENPYKDFNDTLGKRAQTVTRIRDFLAGASSILGKIGMVLTIVGIIISITGIGAVLGGPIATIGRVIGLITLVLDALTFVLSTYLVYLGGIMFKTETDPAKRAKLAKNLIGDANQSFNAAMSVALALPGVQKLAGVVAGGLKGIAVGIISKIATKLGLKVALSALKGAAKYIVNFLKKGVSKIAGLFKGGGEPGMLSKLVGKAGEAGKSLLHGVGNLAERGMKFGGEMAGKIKGSGIWKKGEEAWTKVKGLFAREPKAGPGLMDKLKGYGKRGFKWVDEKSARASEWLEKYTGGKWVEKNIQNRMAYYTNKLAAPAEKAGVQAEQKVESAWEKKLAAQTEQEEAKAAQQATATAEKGETKAVTEGEKAAEKEEVKAADQAAAGGSKDAARPEAKPPSEREKFLEKQAAKDKELAKAEGAAKSEAADERRKLRDLEKKNARPEEIAEQRKKFQEAEEKAQEASTKIQENNAGKRAQARLDEARGIEPTSDRFKRKQGGKEWEDSKFYKDPDKEKFMGQFKEKVLEERERKLSLQEAMDENKKEQDQKGATGQAERTAEGAGEFADHFGKEGHDAPAAAPAGPDAPGPDHEDSAPAAAPPSLPSLDGDQGGLAEQVQEMVGNLDDDPQPEQTQNPDPGADNQAGANAPTAANANAPDSANAAGGGPAPAPSQSGENQDQGGAGADGGKPAQPGAVPYWPELLDEYQRDLGELTGTEAMLKDYKEKQLAGYKQAVGIKEDSQKQKEAAAGRKPTQQQNIQDAQGDQNEFHRSGGEAGKAGSEAQKGQGKKGEAQSAGQEGAGAANTQVPEPPAPSFWQRILNFLKKFLVNYLAKGLQYIQNAFANFILKRFAGVDLESMNACANCSQQKTAEGAKQAQGAQQETHGAEQKDGETQHKADESMTEAQKLQQSTQENIRSADELLGAIARIKDLLQKEIQNGTEFIRSLSQAKEQEKKEQEAREKAAQQKEQQQQAAAQKKQQEEAQAQQQAADKAAATGKKKDEPNPAQVAKVARAANFVATTAGAYHQRVMIGFNEARGALAARGGEEAHKAAAIFTEAAAEDVGMHQQATQQRVSKMQSLAGKGDVDRAQLHTMASQVSESAAEADEDLKGALGSLKANFDACYVHAGKAPQAQPAAQP